jgi:hypothetical protein
MLPRCFPEALEKSGKLGEEGDVDGAMMLTQQADAYKKQYEEMYKRLSTPDRTMTVCEVCGVFINSADVDDKKWGGKVPQPILVRERSDPGRRMHAGGLEKRGSPFSQPFSHPCSREKDSSALLHSPPLCTAWTPLSLSCSLPLTGPPER